MPVDLTIFAPKTTKELFNGIVGHLIPIAGDEWKKNKKDIGRSLENVAAAAYRTQSRLLKGDIGQREADLLLHSQEVALNQVFLYAEFSSYILAKKLLTVVFDVIKAAIKNTTGIMVFSAGFSG